MDKKTCDRLILSRNQRDTEGRTLSDVKCEVDKILIEKWAAEGYDKKGRYVSSVESSASCSLTPDTVERGLIYI